MQLKSKVYNLLRWSEKYTKTDMIYLTKGSFWLTFGQIGTTAIIFALSIGYANLIPQETYGTYKYVISIAGLLASFALRNMGVPVIQAVARGYEGVLIPALKARIKWGTLGSIACLGVAFYYYLQSNTTLFISFLLIAAFLPLMEPFGSFSHFLEGKKLFKNSQVYELISQISVAAIMFAVLIISGNLYLMLLAYFGSWTALHIFFFALTVRKNRPSKNYDPETIPYGKHLSVIGIIGTIIASLDNIIIFHFLGAAELAVYSFAILPIIHLQGLMGKLGVLAMPKFAQRPLQEIRLLLWKRIKFLFVLGMGISLVYIIIAPPVFKIFFPKYIGSIFLSQVFSVSIVLSLIQSILAAALNSKLTIIPKKILYLLNVSGIISIVFMFAFIKPFGAMGVILAKIISLVSVVGVGLVIWKIINKSENRQIAAST